MTAQEAAHRLLSEAGRPQAATTLAERMLKRGMVRSNASDPIQSFAQTIEKNIRDGVYNRPALEFVYTSDGRLIGLPAQASGVAVTKRGANPVAPKVIAPDERAFVEVSARLLNKLGLVVYAELAASREAAADLVIARGLDAMKDEIASGMRSALSSSKLQPTIEN